MKIMYTRVNTAEKSRPVTCHTVPVLQELCNREVRNHVKIFIHPHDCSELAG